MVYVNHIEGIYIYIFQAMLMKHIIYLLLMV